MLEAEVRVDVFVAGAETGGTGAAAGAGVGDAVGVGAGADVLDVAAGVAGSAAYQVSPP